MSKNNIAIISLLIISFSLNFLYISNKNSNAEMTFSDNIEKADLLDELTPTTLDITEQTSTSTSTSTSETILNQDNTSDEEYSTNTNTSTNTNKININTASLEELTTLKSIGEVLAQRIIDYRTEVSSFNNISDIINVSGIGEKTFETLKDFISID